MIKSKFPCSLSIENLNAKFLADVQHLGHFIQAAIKANANADRVKAGLLDHRQIAPSIIRALRQPFDTSRHAAKGVFIVGANA